MKLYLVMFEGKPRAAYPNEVQAKVYASGFSKEGCIILPGEFIPQNEWFCEKCGDFIESGEMRCINDDSIRLCKNCYEKHNNNEA